MLYDVAGTHVALTDTAFSLLATYLWLLPSQQHPLILIPKGQASDTRGTYIQSGL